MSWISAWYLGTGSGTPAAVVSAQVELSSQPIQAAISTAPAVQNIAAAAPSTVVIREP